MTPCRVRSRTIDERIALWHSPGDLATIVVTAGQRIGMSIIGTWVPRAPGSPLESHVHHAIGVTLGLPRTTPPAAPGCEHPGFLPI
jgi:hypothetical protein